MVRRTVSIVPAILLAALPLLSGCSAYRNTVPGYCVGNGWQDSRSDKEPINFLRLRQEPPDAYRLDSRDILGIYIEGVLGNKEEPPPVHFPEEGDNLPPSLGYPVPIRDNGTISLPLVAPIELRGLTIPEAERKIRETYISRRILRPDRERIIVSLMKPRTYHVLVVREDETADNVQTFGGNAQDIALAMALGRTKNGMSYPVELKAYENDVLHALSESGGLPGPDAKNEVIILRGAFKNDAERDYHMDQLKDPKYQQKLMAQPNVIKIPLRLGPRDQDFKLNEQDIILDAGDIVFVRSRESEVFYTGGLLPGGQWPLPRDYDIDVMQAIALAGGNIGVSAGSSDRGFLGGGGVGILFPGTRLIVVRQMCGEQVPIEIDLRLAMTDPSQRVRVQPGDFIVLEFKPGELIANIALSIVRINWFVGN